jgi:Flp pilus assembly secretin CpaC
MVAGTGCCLDDGKAAAWIDEMKMSACEGSGGWRLALIGVACAGALASAATPGGEGERVSVPAARQAAKPAVAVKAYLFTVPDDFAFAKGQVEPGVAGTYDAEAGERLALSLQRRRGFELVQGRPLSATAKSGQPKELKVIREFIYPTEYEPAVPGEVVDGELQSVTPATPVSFEKKDIGVVLEYQAERLADGKIEVALELKRSTFAGFVNYGTPIKGKRKGLFGRKVEVTLSENRIEMPVFDVKQLKTRLRVNDGDFIAVGGMMPGTPPKDPRFAAWKNAGPESGEKNFVALIQVKTDSAK